ncbi:hypothetical protein BDW66DRAFT_51793 [Aspergillus desertorum]
MAWSPTGRNLVAVIIGAVLLFGAISVLPIVIMRRHRRRAADRNASELRALQVNGFTRQVTVQRWLEQQRPTSNIFDRYRGESCPICVSSLLAPSALTASAPISISICMSNSIVHTLPKCQQHTSLRPSPPEAAHITNVHSYFEPCIPPTLTENGGEDARSRPLIPSESKSQWRPSPETSSSTSTSTDARARSARCGVPIVTDATTPSTRRV